MKRLPSLRSLVLILLTGLSVWAPATHHLALLFLPAIGLAGLAMSTVLLQRDQAQQQAETTSTAALPLEQSTVTPIRSLIIGGGEVGSILAGGLEAGGRHLVVGFIDDELADFGKWAVLGRQQATETVIREHEVNEVYLADTSISQQHLVARLMTHCPNVNVHIVPSPYQALMRMDQIKSCGDIAIVTLNPRAKSLPETLKRGFDLIVSTSTLVLLSPLWLLVALLVKLTSTGPVIFAQERIGLFGKPFMVLKFRTMRQDAEATTGPVLSPGKEDDRLTPIGRYLRMFRIDEVPQFWNVMRGEMSLVGPRPERTVFVEQFLETVPMYAVRHQVRPGITGLAQICGGYHTDARDKLRFDLIYVSHRSLWFDLKILMSTILVVIFPGRYGQ